MPELEPPNYSFYLGATGPPMGYETGNSPQEIVLEFKARLLSAGYSVETTRLVTGVAQTYDTI